MLVHCCFCLCDSASCLTAGGHVAVSVGGVQIVVGSGPLVANIESAQAIDGAGRSSDHWVLYW